MKELGLPCRKHDLASQTWIRTFPEQEQYSLWHTKRREEEAFRLAKVPLHDDVQDDFEDELETFEYFMALKTKCSRRWQSYSYGLSRRVECERQCYQSQTYLLYKHDA